MTALFYLPRQLLLESFKHFRSCGEGQRECQVLWLSSWATPQLISEVVHPQHTSHSGGFTLDDRWLTNFWLRLGSENLGIRIQVHTHPFEAFHSSIDDAYPIIHSPGFLSLVIPNFGLGSADLRKTYLAEIQNDGSWLQIPVLSRLRLDDT